MMIQGIALALLGAALAADEPAQGRVVGEPSQRGGVRDVGTVPPRPQGRTVTEAYLLDGEPARVARYSNDVLIGGDGADPGQAPGLRDWIYVNQAQEDLSLAAADESLRAQLRLPEGQGLVVTAVAPGGEAARAGLAANDILLTLGDQPLAKPDDLDKCLKDGERKPLELKVLRSGKPTTLRVRPRYRVTLAPAEPATPHYYIGVPASPVDETLRSHLDLPDGQGLIVTGIVPDSPAAKAGLQKNDILLKLGDKPLTDVESLVAQIQAVGGKATPLELVRGGKRQTLTITPERRKSPPEEHGLGVWVEPHQLQLKLSDLAKLKGQAPRTTFYFTPAEPAPLNLLRWHRQGQAGPGTSPDDLKGRLDELSSQIQALQKSVEELRKSMK